MKKIDRVICSKYKKSEKPKISFILKKHSKHFFSLFAVSSRMKIKKYLKKKNQLRYGKFFLYMKIYNCFKNISQEFRLKNIVHELEPKKMGSWL